MKKQRRDIEKRALRAIARDAKHNKWLQEGNDLVERLKNMLNDEGDFELYYNTIYCEVTLDIEWYRLSKSELKLVLKFIFDNNLILMQTVKRVELSPFMFTGEFRTSDRDVFERKVTELLKTVKHLRYKFTTGGVLLYLMNQVLL